VIPLDEAEVRHVAGAIRASAEIDAIAVCLLFSYLNPQHELRVRDILAEELPEKALSVSYALLQKWKEYERAPTTIADAYLKRIVGRKLRAMRGRLNEGAHGTGGDHQVEWWRNDAELSKRLCRWCSGPTGGVIASRSIAMSSTSSIW
jgi:N-methylhydantoinase A